MTLSTNPELTVNPELTASSDLAQRAMALVSLLDRHAAWSDENGRLHDEVVETFHREGMFLMWVPKELGGFELTPVESLEVLALTSYGDASAGWVQMAACLSIGTGAAYLGDAAVATLFHDGTYPVIAGQGTRPGSAVTVEGGHRVTGQWGFASGLLHGSHIHTLAITDRGEGRIFVLPVDQPGIDLKLDSWNVMGLRGTGSIDYDIDDVFVPEDFSHFAFTTEPRRGGAIYRSGIIGTALICHSGWAIGVGRRLLDELSGYVRAKVGRPGSVADSDAFQQRLAQLEGQYRAAKAFAYEAWADATETMLAGSPLSRRQNTLIRLALGHITAVLHDVAQGVYLLSGTTGLRNGTIQRLVRDVHAGTQYVTSGPNMWQNVGKELLGMGEGKQWILLDLVDAS